MAIDGQQLYDAFRSSCAVDDDGDPLLPMEQLPDRGRGWYSLARSIDQIAAEPTDVDAPYDVDLIEIPKRFLQDGTEIIEGPAERPSKITVRAFRADDLCVSSWGSDEYMHAVFARAVGLDLSTVEWRMDPADVEAGTRLCGAAGGADADDLCSSLYSGGGGEQLLKSSEPVMLHAWIEVARAALTTYDGDTARVRCRTPGVGEIVIGPLKAGHLRLHTGTAQRTNEWNGRLVALAKAGDRSRAEIGSLRTEDVFNLWAAFEKLKKKVEQRTITLVAGQLSRRSSQAGDQTTSTS